MSEEQDKQRNTRKKENNRLLTKAAIIGVVAGLLGGGIAYGGLSAANLNSNTSSSTASSSSSNTGENGSVTTSSSGTTKVNKSTITSGTMTSAYKKVQNAVVSVLNYKYTSSSSSSSDIYSIFGYGDSDSSDSSSSKKSLTLYSEGSGVIYTTANGKGYIVTNNHVISGAAKVKVMLDSGKTIAANVVGKDSTSDLAVLSIDSKYVTQTASFGDSSSLQSAQTVIAIGSPEGYEYASTVTQGIISSPSRTITYNSNQMTVIQTDAAINSGKDRKSVV